MTNTIKATYQINLYQTLIVEFDLDNDETSFTEIGGTFSDDLVFAAADAGGGDFIHDGITYTSTLS